MRYSFGLLLIAALAGCDKGENRVIDNSNREKPSAASLEEFNAAMSNVEPMKPPEK